MASTNIKVSHATSGLVRAEVVAAQQISLHLMRLTFGGADLAKWRHLGFDQWFRLALPLSDATSFRGLSDRFDMRGYLKYLPLPKATRPVIRSYTVRDFPADSCELDVDFILHGDSGVAGPWAAKAPIGSPVALIDQGCGYRQVAETTHVLLAGDETALPAILGILRDLPSHYRGKAFIEVPHQDDIQEVTQNAEVDCEFLVRASTDRAGSLALTALQQSRLAVPGEQISAFIAGEQALATSGRRHLVTLSIPKTNIDFVGYWRLKR